MARGGEAVDDPKGWFDSLSGETVAFWDAFEQLEPMGQDYSRWAEMMELQEHIFAAYINKGRKRNDPEAYKPRKRKDFMPAYFAGDRPKQKQQKIGEQLDEFAKKFQEATNR